MLRETEQLLVRGRAELRALGTWEYSLGTSLSSVTSISQMCAISPLCASYSTGLWGNGADMAPLKESTVCYRDIWGLRTQYIPRWGKCDGCQPGDLRLDLKGWVDLARQGRGDGDGEEGGSN